MKRFWGLRVPYGHGLHPPMARTEQNPKLAVGFILCATAFIAGTMVLAKFLSTNTFGDALHPLQISHGRFIFAFLALSTAAAILRPRIERPNLKLHIGRSFFGWGGVTLMFASVAFIPLPDATAISFLNPVFGMMLAIPFLGETVGRVRWSAAAIALAGAMILLRPSAESVQAGALLALCAAMLMGAELIFIKKLADREAPFQILLLNNAIGLGISSVAVLPVWVMPTGPQWMALAALGVLMACAQSLFVNAMARADASFVTPFTYVTLIFAALYDVVFFDTLPDAVSVVGVCVILGGAMLLAWRQARIKA